MIKYYPIKGLSKPNSVTLEHKNHFFWANTNLSTDKFIELFNFVSDNWNADEPYYAKLEFDTEAEDGTPINATMIEFSLTLPTNEIQ